MTYNIVDISISFEIYVDKWEKIQWTNFSKDICLSKWLIVTFINNFTFTSHSVHSGRDSLIMFVLNFSKKKKCIYFISSLYFMPLAIK